jgi:hypothetical protein
MCDCWMCNQTQEEFDDGYLEYEYQEYCKTTDKPLSMDEWFGELIKSNTK